MNERTGVFDDYQFCHSEPAMSAEKPVNAHTPCVPWLGYIDENGYGRTSYNGKTRGAHRVAYEKAKGPIPAGLVIDHLCRNRCCVNPDHLEAVTPLENTRRGREATKTHCVHGHALTPDNLDKAPGRKRACKKCGRDRWHAYKKRRVAAGTWVDTRRRAREAALSAARNTSTGGGT